jgi:rhodanese-related sulfurtransferase
VDAGELQQALYLGECLMVDLRRDQEFQAEHIPGSSLATYRPEEEELWLETVASWQRGHRLPLVLTGSERSVLNRLSQRLEAQGVKILEVLEDALSLWQANGYDVARIHRLEAQQLAESLDEWRVVDVREPHEWESGVIPGAILMTLGAVPERSDELDRSSRYAVVCAHGHRSRLASNWLADHGFNVANVEGGMAAWMGSVVYPGGHETES